MTENQNNIWNKIEVSFPTKPKVQNFGKKSVVIKQIEKEKTITQGNQNLNGTEQENTNGAKKLFINKKRGRRLKKSNEEVVTGSHDRFSDDNLKRKVKTHFHNYIIALLNKNFVVEPGLDKSLKFGKIKSNITQNITVEYNQFLFNQKIKDIIVDVSNKYQNQQINSECIEYVKQHQKENAELNFYLNMIYKDLYLNYYLKSTKNDFLGFETDESYEAHIEKLKKFGEQYIKNYEKNAANLIDFYKTVKKRKARKKKGEKNNDSSLLDNSFSIKKKLPYFENEDICDKNLLEDENNNVYLGSNKTSTSTQTDRKLTDDESESDY